MDLINPSIDRESVRNALARDGVAQVVDYLPTSTASALFECLDGPMPWDLAFSRDGRGELIKAAELATMSAAQVRQATSSAVDFQRSSFQFLYDTFKVIDSFVSREFADHPLYHFANALHSASHLRFVRELTGVAQICRMDLFAARYRPGHFLTLHDDIVPGEGREVAYVINLSRAWQPEWGGLLHIADGTRREVVRTFTPRFNSIVLFRPPLWHFVSQVATYAPQPRYTLTGWMLST